MFAYSPESNTLVTDESRDGPIGIWDAETGQLLHTLAGPTRNVTFFKYSPDGQTLASGNKDGALRFWDVETGQFLQQTFIAHTGDVSSLAYSPDGRTFASANSDEIRVWDIKTRQLLQTLAVPPQGAGRLEYSPDGSTLVGRKREEIIVWELKSGALKYIFRWDAWHSADASAPDGSTLAGGGWDGIRLWDAQTGGIRHEFKHHWPYYVSAVAYSPDGRMLASGSEDRTVRLWNLDTGQNVQIFIGHQDEVSELVYSPDGRTLASGGYDGTILLWDVSHHLQEPRATTAAPAITAVSPIETALLPNYPNPFNPETWIPYQLAAPAEVTVRIYTANGQRVRTLALGYQPAGSYQQRHRAAYWDGKNQMGEPVASGLYFYTFSAGDFTTTRKMLLRK